MLEQSNPGYQQPEKSDPVLAEGMDAMGKPIPNFRKQNAYQQAKEMGLNTEMAWRVVNAVADKLERDDPFGAQEQGMKFLDITGVYRLMSYLLTGGAA